jgi:REP element-mobilizing transposase RayT
LNIVFSDRKPNRLRGYDYSLPGYYFVTICVTGHQPLLAEIENRQLYLNDAGRIVDFSWNDLVNHYPDIALDEYVIMPDHFHGILRICPATNQPGKKRHGLPEIIRGFKTFSSRRINEKMPWVIFKWQKSYHDRIIRNDKELAQTRAYIINNPANWG